MFEVFSPHKILGGANGHILLDAASNLILLEGNSSGVKE
jgi:hypothetical protein